MQYYDSLHYCTVILCENVLEINQILNFEN